MCVYVCVERINKTQFYKFDKFHFFYLREVFEKAVKLATIVEGDQKAPFSIATTPRRRIAQVYSWYFLYIAEC